MSGSSGMNHREVRNQAVNPSAAPRDQRPAYIYARRLPCRGPAQPLIRNLLLSSTRAPSRRPRSRPLSTNLVAYHEPVAFEAIYLLGNSKLDCGRETVGSWVELTGILRGTCVLSSS